MNNLKTLKIKRKEILERIEELEKELRKEWEELNNLDDQIAEIEGIPDEIEDIRLKAKNFTMNIKKRSRPKYKGNFKEEQEERTEKRQRRNGKQVGTIQDEIIMENIRKDVQENEVNVDY